MGAILPPQVAESETSRYLTECGLKRVHQGKVRDTYEYPGRNDLLLVVASDRVSIFDVVLGVEIPQKGEILTAMTLFWLTDVLEDFPHHLAAESDTNEHVGEVFPNLPAKVRRRCLLVKRAEIPPYEMIFRHHLGGSVYKAYSNTGYVAGQQIKPGFPKWHKLDTPLFTPSTKEETGHDINISVQQFYAAMGERGTQAVEMFTRAYKRAYEYAEKLGILILDTKFEGLDMIADEVLTPDSSRFTTEDDFIKAVQQGRDPTFYDKQFLREWGMQVETPWGRGLNNKNLDLAKPECREFICGLSVPADIVLTTKNRYEDIFTRLTGYTLHEYQGLWTYR